MVVPSKYCFVGLEPDQLDLSIQKNHCSVLVVDHEGVVTKTNHAFLSSTGYTPEQIAGSPVHRLVELDGPFLDWLNDYNHNIRTCRSLPTVHIRTNRDETICTEVSVVQYVIDEKNYYLLFFHDVHDCNNLSLLQQFSGTFLKDVNLGVLLINMDFKLVDISQTACKVLGVQRKKVMGKPMEDVFSSVPMDHQLVQRTILDGVVVKNHAVSWMNNQKRYELLVDSNLLKDHEGNTVGAYVIFKDVTNLRSLEEQVQRSDRLAMIGQIAAGTAHEIRNPLTSIKGFLQVLKRTMQVNGMDKEFEYTEIMLTEIDRINELVSEFLLLSKPKNVTYDTVDVSTVLREILPIINNEAILHGVAVQYQAEFQLPKVVADREMLKQVCLNICKNGIEAMVEGGSLTITEKLDLEEHKVNVEIHDTGPGIPVFLIDKIFDPFFTTKENGTGLGLSVCQRIIHDIGGTIRVSSKGFGTTFTISIPYPMN